MKKYRSILVALMLLGLSAPVVLQTGCTSKQSQNAYVTIDATGKAAKASLDASTQLLKQGAITVAQWQKIADAYDNVFQPAYALAIASAGVASAPAPQALIDQQTALAASVKNLTP